MKKLKWVLQDADDKVLEVCYRRSDARESKEWYTANIFADWMGDWKPPIKIVRQQWELVEERVIR